MAKFKPYNLHQQMLFPACVDDYVPQGHLARLVSEIVDQLNTSEIEIKYSELGQNTYHPKLLIKLLFYGYTTGVRSGRKIATNCETDTAYMYLSCLYRPDFRTINDFRKNNLGQISHYFKNILQVCKDLGMIKVGRVSVDSVKIRANASAKRTKDKTGFKKWMAKIDDQIKQMLNEAAATEAQEDKEYGKENRGDELPENIKQKQDLKEKIKSVLSKIKSTERINLTDQDARHIKDNQVIKPNYNCQAAACQNGIILCAYATNTASDSHQLLPALQQVEENIDQQIDEVLADSGYGSYANYQALEENGKTAYIPDQGYAKERKEKNKEIDYRYDKTNFTYDVKADRYVCPEGELLEPRGTSKEHDRVYKIYKGIKCQNCPVKHLCTTAKVRMIKREFREAARERVISRLLTKEGQHRYNQRGAMIEPRFGHIKHNLGYRMFHLRGLKKADGEFKLMCMCSNILRIYHHKTKENLKKIA